MSARKIGLGVSVGLTFGLMLATVTAIAAVDDPQPAGTSQARNSSATSTVAGCPVFPQPPRSLSARAPSIRSLAAWNQNISKAPVARASSAIVKHINSSGGNDVRPGFGSSREYGIPFRVVGAKQRPKPIRYTHYGATSDRGPFPIPLTAPVEGGRQSDGDRHVLVLDRSRCMLYELYRAYPRAVRRPHWRAGSGAKWNLRSADTRPEGWTSADAAGLPILPGLIRFSEVHGGRINHAVRVTFSPTRDARIRPATHCAGSTLSRRAPAMGMRFRLKAGYKLRGIDGQALIVARALKRYGMIVADNGPNWTILGAPNPRWDDENLKQLEEIPGTAFEVVKSAARAEVCGD